MLQAVAESRIGAVGMPECQNGCPGSLGQKSFGPGHHAGHNGRHRQTVFQGQDHDIIKHLLLFNQRDSGLIVNKQHIDDAVAFLHDLGGVIAS